MKNRFNLILILSLGFSGLIGCASKTIQSGSFQKAQWESKALIKDSKQNKNQSVSIDILAIKNDRARFEISALLGIRVASIVMSQREISYALYQQKLFYYGRNSETAFARVLDLPLHPMNLSNIAFDEPIRGVGWKCQLDATGMISACENPGRKLNVQWTERNQGGKKVVINAPDFEMIWIFEAPQTEVQFKNETFTLVQPQGFKAVQIN